MKKFVPILCAFSLVSVSFAGRIVIVSQGFANVGWSGDLDPGNGGVGLWTGQGATYWVARNELSEGPQRHQSVLESGAIFGFNSFHEFLDAAPSAKTTGDSYWCLEYIPEFEGDAPPQVPLLATIQARVRGFSTASNLLGAPKISCSEVGPHLRWEATALPEQQTSMHSGDGWDIDPVLTTVQAKFTNSDGRWLARVTEQGGGSASFNLTLEGAPHCEQGAWVQAAFTRQEQILDVGPHVVNPRWTSS